MKKTTNKPAFIPTMYCNLFGHDFEVTKKVTFHIKEYTCKHCKKQLTPKFKEINNILERIHNSRTQRSKMKLATSSIY